MLLRLFSREGSPILNILFLDFAISFYVFIFTVKVFAICFLFLHSAVYIHRLTFYSLIIIIQAKIFYFIIFYFENPCFLSYWFAVSRFPI